MAHPTREECLKYLDAYGTPAKVIGHCKAVAAVAAKLGEALNQSGGTKAAAVSHTEIEKVKRNGDGGRFFYRSVTAEGPELPYRPFDMDMVWAAGLLHDMARVEECHWDVAADFCEERGYYDVAKIIRAHMQFEFTCDAQHLSEIDLVCLGDRLTMEDRYVGLDRRMEYVIQKAERNGHPEARPIILEKKKHTRKLLDEIEKRTGSIDALMENLDYDR